MSITEVAIKRPLLISVLFLVLILAGFLGYHQLNYNLLPKFEAPVLSIQTVYRGASAEEVETNVTKKIEDAVSTIEGMDIISSTSMENVSVVVLQLKQNTVVNDAQQDAQRKLNNVKNDLPDGVDEPIISKFSSSDLPVLRMTLFADNMGDAQFYDFIDQTIKPIILNLDGVGQAKLIGGTEREISVMLDNEKLRAYNLSSAQVSQAIAMGNISFPVGSIENSENRFNLRLDAKFTTVDQLRNLIVRENKNGSKILLKDIATVTDGTIEPTTINRINGRVGLGMEINKQTDANAVEVAQLVKERLDTLVNQYKSKGLNYKIAIDQSKYTLEAANAVQHDLVLAVIIVAFVMLFFLHSLKSSFFVLVALPSAMIPTFMMMYLMGFSLNLMTLLALSLVVGVLVDDSIVILENIYRHMEMGKNRVKASLEGRAEIAFTALAITLVDVVVFVPLSLAGGLIGNILREFALVVVVSTLMSLLVSFTLTPLLASRFGSVAHLDESTLWGKLNIKFEQIIEKLIEKYGQALDWGLSHKRYVLLGVICLFAGAFSLVGFGWIGSSFAGSGDRGEFSLTIELDPQANLNQTNKVVKQIENIILEYPEIDKVFTKVGAVGTQMGESIATPNQADITATLIDKTERKITTEQLTLTLRDRFDSIPGIKFSMKPTNVTGNNQPQIQIVVMNPNMDSLQKATQMIYTFVKKTPGTDYVELSTKKAKTEAEIVLNRDKIAKLGLTIPMVGVAVQLAFRGDDQSKFKQNGEEYTINVMYDKEDRKSITNIENTILQTPSGGIIRVGDVADIKEIAAPEKLERYNRLSSLQVLASTVGRPTGSVMVDIKKDIENAKFPVGTSVDYLGEEKNQSDSFGSLGLAMGIGILLVYLIMVALYESTLYPFVVLFSIPVALIGAILALALTMESLSIFGIVGFIMLMGLVAKNGILIVDFINQIKHQGHTLKEACIEAGRERLRPILMTTLAMVFGMLPIALSNGPGSEFKKSMAWVIIGGLTSSLLLTLFVVPTVYYIVETLKNKFDGRKSNQNKNKMTISEMMISE